MADHHSCTLCNGDGSCEPPADACAVCGSKAPCDCNMPCPSCDGEGSVDDPEGWHCELMSCPTCGGLGRVDRVKGTVRYG